MRLHYTDRFLKDYAQAPLSIQRAFDRKAAFLTANILHPSLRAKKYNEADGTWQARVTDNWRFYFKIEGDIYYLLRLIPHPK